MKDRIKLGLIAAACIAVCAMMWSMMRQGRQVNEAMLAHLASLAPAVKAMETEAELALEWSEVTLTLVKGEEGSEPVSGASITFRGNAFGSGERLFLTGHTSEQGVAHFGPVRPGLYELSLRSPNGYEYSTLVVLYPGRREEVRVDCPESLEFEMLADVRLPEDLMAQDLVFYFSVPETNRTFHVGRRKWWFTGGSGQQPWPGRGYTYVYLPRVSFAFGELHPWLHSLPPAGGLRWTLFAFICRGQELRGFV